jgi:hypothetical protein
MSGLNASEKFRESMSQMAHEELGDSAVEAFKQKEAARQIPDPEAEKAAAEAKAAEEAAAAAAAAAAEGGEQVEPDPAAVEGEEAEVVVETEHVEDEEDPIIDIGEGQTVRFSELVSGHLRQADYTRKTQALAEERRSFEQERERINQSMVEAATRATNLAAQLEARLQNPQLRAELEQLRQTDPGEYAARITELQQQHGMVQAAKYEQERIYNEARAAEVPRQRHLLGTVLPEFEGEKFDASYKVTGEYALGAGGLQPEEWSQLVDHRHVALVEKARRYDELTSKTPKLPKNIAKIPRSVRPGAASELRKPGQAADQDYQAALAAQKESGGLDDTAQAFLAMERKRNAR